MRHMSTLALCELLTEVVAELDARGRAIDPEDGGVVGGTMGHQDGSVEPLIATAWGEAHHTDKGWRFAWNSEGAAEAARYDWGHGVTTGDPWAPQATAA